MAFFELFPPLSLSRRNPQSLLARQDKNYHWNCGPKTRKITIAYRSRRIGVLNYEYSTRPEKPDRPREEIARGRCTRKTNINNQNTPFCLILASSSPRRRALLDEAGMDYIQVAPSVTESELLCPAISPIQHAEALAYLKARSVADHYPEDVVLAADTICELNGRILGKAGDAESARRMLAELSGTRHKVITAVAICIPGGDRLIASDVTEIEMKKMTPQEIDQYVAGGEWEGKAGAYAIQETADRYVKRIQGSFSNVVGLPMELLAVMLDTVKRRSESRLFS